MKKFNPYYGRACLLSRGLVPSRRHYHRSKYWPHHGAKQSAKIISRGGKL